MNTDKFTLPSGIECEIKEFDGKTEKLLFDQGMAKQGRTGDVILARSLISLDGKTFKDEAEAEAAVLDLYIGDRNYMTVKVRILNYGPEMYINHQCPNCKTWGGYQLNLEDMLKGDGDEDFAIRPYGGDVTVTLSNGDKAVLTEMTGHTERRLALLKELTSLDIDTACVASVNGERPKRSYFDNLPARDIKLIRDTYNEKLNGGMDGVVFLTCAGCNAENDVKISREPDFFLPGRMRSARRTRS